MSSFESPELEFIHGIQSGLLMRPPGGAIVRRWETFAETLGAIGSKRRELWEGGERVDSESFPPGDARVRPGSAPPPSFLPLSVPSSFYLLTCLPAPPSPSFYNIAWWQVQPRKRGYGLSTFQSKNGHQNFTNLLANLILKGLFKFRD